MKGLERATGCATFNDAVDFRGKKSLIGRVDVCFFAALLMVGEWTRQVAR